MDIIQKDEMMIGYAYDIARYIKDLLIEQLNNNEYDMLNDGDIRLLRELYTCYDDELLKITCDYDGDYTIKQLQEV